MTPEMLNLQWNANSLYPAGVDARQLQAQASVTLPKGWSFATALETARPHRPRPGREGAGAPQRVRRRRQVAEADGRTDQAPPCAGAAGRQALWRAPLQPL
ncbi:hypothetical protein G6F66_015098 [Rhizopus arrhizus]|nr:hypothetical protein G6F66_015098 [Rhizopus arrhizus]